MIFPSCPTILIPDLILLIPDLILLIPDLIRDLLPVMPGPFPVMPDLIGHLLARRSTLWTFRTLFPYFFCAKVHLLDLRDSGRNTLRRPWFSSLLSPVFKDEPRFKTFSSLFWAIFKDEIRFCTVSPPIIVKAHFPRPEPPLRPLLVL